VTLYFNLPPGVRYIVNREGEPVLQESKTNRGLCIEGVATKYSTMMYESSGRWINVMPGAFTVSMKHEAPIECWLDHSSKLVLKGCLVELFDDEEALNFRVHLSESEICNHARDLVESGLYSQCSLGWHSSAISKRNIGGTEVNFILGGTLTELSILPTGACPTTHCQISRLADCGTLEHDCKSFRMKSDNSFMELRRSLKRLEEQ
jgi:HK97 family phage prohead protease